MLRQIYLFSPIGSASSETIIRQLLDLDRESDEEITIFINSPGGAVTSLFSIIDVMQACRSSIRTVVVGQAASAAAIIAACGDKRLITENSEVMIHEVLSISFGTTSQLQEDMKRVEEMQNRIINVLSKKTKKTREQLQLMIKKTDKYLSASEAVRMGFCDTIIRKNEAQVLRLCEVMNTVGHEFDYQEDGLSVIQLLKEGKYIHPVYGEFFIDEGIMHQMVDNFDKNVRGIDISIDYTHDNESGERPAACWVKQLFIDGTEGEKGLYAKVEFTPKGRELVLQKEYQYASADFSINYATESGNYVPYVLRGGTLTNRPFIKEMNPIKLSEPKQKGKETVTMKKEQLIAALQEQGVNVLELQNSLQNALAETESLKNQITELGLLKEDNEQLKNKLDEISARQVSSQKEVAFEKLVKEGKVAPAQKEAVLKKFISAEEITSFYKDAPAVVNLHEKGSEKDNNDHLTEDEELAVNSGEVSREDVLKNREIKH